MYNCNIANIQIAENRQRREFNPQAITDLGKSIQSTGLLHPIVCRRLDNNVVQLVSGERRLRAIQQLVELEIPFMHGNTAYVGGMVPVNLIDDLSDEKAFEAELEENIMRVDLTWQERSLAVAQLHNLRSKQAEARGEVQTLRQTANELAGGESNNYEFVQTRNDAIVAKHLNDPEVAKAPSVKEALKVIEKKKKVEHRAKLAEQFDASKSQHVLHNGDFFELIETIPTASIDCILTDPPYGVDATEFGSNFHTEHDYQDDWEYFQSISQKLAFEAMRVLKPDTHAYVFCSFEGFSVLAADFAAAGFKVWNQPLIWSKGNGNAPWINAGHKKTYECIMFASKGSRDMTSVKPDVLSYGIVLDRDHAAQKPVALYVDLLRRSTNPGETVLDGFAGSGTIFAAANEAKLKAIGFERSQAHFNTALLRLDEDGIEL